MRPFSPFKNEEVLAVFNAYPADIKAKMLQLRQLILDTAAEIPDLGILTETLKWGEPSYLTTAPKSGSTIRIDWKPNHPHQYAMYFNCRTSLIDSVKSLYGDMFQYQGNRALIFRLDTPLPYDELADCISLALTYHRNK